MCNNKNHKNNIKESINESNIKESASHNTSKNNCDDELTDEKDFNDELDSATFVSIMQLLW